MTVRGFRPLFVEYIPDRLEDGILYLSMEFATASHACACGCGREVVTPLSPVGWQMRYDGENVSLEPSIGNWSYPCRSHYWIKGGHVRWDKDIPQRAVEEGRERDRQARDSYYAGRSHALAPAAHTGQSAQTQPSVQLPAATREVIAPAPRTWWDKLVSAFRRR